jgi:hypothetical protein
MQWDALHHRRFKAELAGGGPDFFYSTMPGQYLRLHGDHADVDPLIDVAFDGATVTMEPLRCRSKPTAARKCRCF